MAISPEYREFLADLLRPVGAVDIRRMFGGAGLFYGKAMFGLIARETLFMKVDASNRTDYESEGSRQFTYESPSGKLVEFGYFELPERLFDEPDEFVAWARKAIAVALDAERRKPQKQSRAAKRVKSKQGAKPKPAAKRKAAVKAKRAAPRKRKP